MASTICKRPDPTKLASTRSKVQNEKRRTVDLVTSYWRRIVGSGTVLISLDIIFLITLYLRCAVIFDIFNDKCDSLVVEHLKYYTMVSISHTHYYCTLQTPTISSIICGKKLKLGDVVELKIIDFFRMNYAIESISSYTIGVINNSIYKKKFMLNNHIEFLSYISDGYLMDYRGIHHIHRKYRNSIGRQFEFLKIFSTYRFLKRSDTIKMEIIECNGSYFVSFCNNNKHSYQKQIDLRIGYHFAFSFSALDNVTIKIRS